MDSIGSLRKPDRAEQIIEDVLRQVRAGELVAGDRLLSVKTLCTHYGRSQRIVLAALHRLVERGVLRVRKNKGFFVTAQAPEEAAAGGAAESAASPLSSAPAASATPSPALPRRDGTTTRTYRPENGLFAPKAPPATLRLYLADITPSKLALWRSLADEFASTRLGGARRIEIVSYLDGHLEDLWARSRLDLVQATPLQLASLGWERFFQPPSLEALGIDEDGLLGWVREYMAMHAPFAGIPFSHSLPYLFVNRELHARLPSGTPLPATWSAALMQGAILERVMPEEYVGVVCACLYSWLVRSGGIARDADGRPVLSPVRAKADLDALASFHSRFEGHYEEDRSPEWFDEGRLLFLGQWSFHAPELHGRASFPWEAQPLPEAPNAPGEGTLLALAIHRETPHLDACLELARYLASEPVQRRFAALHGNLPVVEASAFAPEHLATHPLPERTIRAAYERCRPPWRTDLASYRLEVDVNRCGDRLLKDEADAAETMERIALLFERFRQTRNDGL